MAVTPSPGAKGLRRSLHFVPGGNARMFEKALSLNADSLILDLEDSVTPENKADARQAVCDWISQADFGAQECLVRINPQDSPWGREDLEAVVAATPDGLMLPKVLNRANVDAVDQLVTALEKKHGVTSGAISLLLIGTEAPEAVFALPTMGVNTRVDGLTWGAEDLAGALGSKSKRNAEGEYLDVFRYVRSTCLLAAVASNVQPIDSVYVEISDSQGLEKECMEAAAMGFRGKLTIHPGQVDIVNRAFTPSHAEIAEAKELLAAFADNKSSGKMAFAYKGQMVDVPHLKRAQQILAIAAHISGQSS
ncbi:MAG TPA: CoA ester lyase [Gammaproteobacteria bacterium]|nr:CoA ester lyase [Gammaproteobacteria bacterium]